MDTITVEDLKRMILEAGRQIEDHENWLSELDAAIGDGDHGVSMTRGMRAVRAQLEKTEYTELGALLTDSGKVLMKEVGGTCGPLFGTIFLKMSGGVSGKTAVGLPEWASMLEQGLTGVKSIGKAEVGDKTMVDALEPAVRFVADCASRNGTLRETAAGAAEAAMDGAKGTIELVARRGRGRYQNEASTGHQDAGATSVAIMFKGFSEALQTGSELGEKA